MAKKRQTRWFQVGASAPIEVVRVENHRGQVEWYRVTKEDACGQQVGRGWGYTVRKEELHTTRAKALQAQRAAVAEGLQRARYRVERAEAKLVAIDVELAAEASR